MPRSESRLAVSPFFQGVEPLEPRQFLSVSPALNVPALNIPTPPVLTNSVVNGGFEDPVAFNGWTTDGNATIQGSNYVAPPQGQEQAVLSTGTVPTLGNTPDTAANLESFLSLPTGLLSKGNNGPAIDGTAIKQTFTSKGIELISFQANFLTNETGTNDYGFVTLTNGKGGTQFFKIRGPLHATSDLDAANTSENSESGYHTYYLLVPGSGNWTLGFGVVNTVNAEVLSNLAVDNVQATPIFGPGGFFGGFPFGVDAFGGCSADASTSSFFASA